MKKIIITFLVIFLVILTIVSVSLIENNKNLIAIQKANKDYEEYLRKKIYGTDIITIINKATDSNNANEVTKDSRGYYIQNDTNSIQVEIKMLNEGKYKTYQMETVQKVGMEGFIQNFNLIQFQCTNIEYHESTKKISKIIFEQVEE